MTDSDAHDATSFDEPASAEGRAASGETASDEPGAEKGEAPEARPEETAPEHAERVSHEGTPVEGTSAERTRAEGTRAKGTPAEGTPEAPKRLYPVPADDDPLDLSTHGFRQLLGGLGIALPPLCWLWANLLPPTGTSEGLLARLWPLRSLDSVSAYYHTSAVWAFVGILVAMGLFLFTYRGYNDRRQRLDYWVSNFAGAMAVLVAIFPTAPPPGAGPPWWTEVMGTIHLGAAFLLFGSFIVFCWFLFPTKDKRVSETTRQARGYASLTFRERVKKYPVYYGCGLGIALCLVVAGLQSVKGGSIFMAEWWALWFFGISWLRKGQVLWSLRHVGRKMAEAVD